MSTLLYILAIVLLVFEVERVEGRRRRRIRFMPLPEPKPATNAAASHSSLISLTIPAALASLAGM
jgi:hypothetical protein